MVIAAPHSNRSPLRGAGGHNTGTGTSRCLRTEGKLRHEAPRTKCHTSPPHSSQDLRETPSWPQTHSTVSPRRQAGPPSSQGAGQGLPRARGLPGPQRPAQAGAGAAVPTELRCEQLPVRGQASAARDGHGGCTGSGTGNHRGCARGFWPAPASGTNRSDQVYRNQAQLRPGTGTRCHSTETVTAGTATAGTRHRQ